MKRKLIYVALALALLPGLALAQNINRSLQGSQDPRGPVGLDNSNAAYFPGHINSIGPPTSPSVTVCGTGATLVGTDNAGLLTVGNTAGTGGTSCAITFSSPFNAAPHCVFTLFTSVPAGVTNPPLQYSSSTTGVTLTVVTSGQTYQYVCLGNM